MGSKTFRKLQWLIVLPVVAGIGPTHYNNKVLVISQWLGFHSLGSISFFKVWGGKLCVNGVCCSISLFFARPSLPSYASSTQVLYLSASQHPGMPGQQTPLGDPDTMRVNLTTTSPDRFIPPHPLHQRLM